MNLGGIRNNVFLCLVVGILVGFDVGDVVVQVQIFDVELLVILDDQVDVWFYEFDVIIGLDVVWVLLFFFVFVVVQVYDGCFRYINVVQSGNVVIVR